jgi:hypothetical protein
MEDVNHESKLVREQSESLENLVVEHVNRQREQSESLENLVVEHVREQSESLENLVVEHVNKGVDRQGRSPRPSVGCLSIAKAIADHPLYFNLKKLSELADIVTYFNNSVVSAIPFSFLMAKMKKV